MQIPLPVQSELKRQKVLLFFAMLDIVSSSHNHKSLHEPYQAWSERQESEGQAPFATTAAPREAASQGLE